MIQEQKELLLKDLCARLPYGIKVVDLNSCVFTVKGIDGDFPLVDKYSRFGNTYHTVGYGWKPYIRPMSSMTEDEKKEFDKITLIHTPWGVQMDRIPKLIDWLNKKMFDYRNLISMGLALEAQEGIYK